MAGWLKPRTLFGRTALTVATAFLVFQFLALALAVYFVLLPMAKRSADDLAALMVLSAQTWVELPPETRPDFIAELAHNHHLDLAVAPSLQLGSEPHRPYLLLLENALEARTGRAIRIEVDSLHTDKFWAIIPTGDQAVRIGFSHERIGVKPPLAVVLILGLGALFALLTTLVVVRRTTRPLAQLARAAAEVGRGQLPELLDESGPEELAMLARSFNRMAWQVRELLANRTTLLAGISHDLRTPLARLRLALEILAENPNPKLLAGMQRDLEEMDGLIGAFLELSRGLQQEKTAPFEIGQLIGELVGDARRTGATIEWPGCAAPCVHEAGATALRRILANLIENALRYGDGKPILLSCVCERETTLISVLDRGPGIPPEQVEAVFRPFYRLETSRSKATGGSGLGLAIARQLAEANGWRIQLLPRVGGGTEARLSLPATIARSAPPIAS